MTWAVSEVAEVWATGLKPEVAWSVLPVGNSPERSWPRAALCSADG